MSYIKICPEHAKRVQIYTLPENKRYEIKTKENKEIDVHLVIDDGKAITNEPHKIVLERIGEYRVKVVMNMVSSLAFSRNWLGRGSISFYDIKWHVDEKEKTITFTEMIANYTARGEITFAIHADSDIVLKRILIIVEELHT